MILLWHDRTEMKTLVFTVCNKESQKCFFFVLSLLLFFCFFFALSRIQLRLDSANTFTDNRGEETM